MQIQIVLDNPLSTWTNLDVLIGKIILQTSSPTPIMSILVKLEGESRSRIKALQPRVGRNGVEEYGTERSVMREESHKILYKTTVLFPDEETLNQVGTPRIAPFEPGLYEYPFVFKASAQAKRNCRAGV